MRTIFIINTLLIGILLSSCNNNQNNNSNHPKGSEITIVWELQSSVVEGNRKSKAEFKITNKSAQTIGNQGWTVYFNQMPSAIINESLPAEIIVEHISGDYYKFYPTDSFKPLEAGQAYSFSYEN